MTALTITSSTTAGYYLSNTAANPVTVVSGVTITDVGFPALGTEKPAYWTIINSGTLLATGKSTASDGIWLYGSGNGGAISNTASGSITGYYVGVSVAARGTVVNQGTITTTGTSGNGYLYTLASQAFTATSAGVLLGGGGGVSNASNGLIAAYFEGVAVSGGGSVVNAGTILASSTRGGLGVVLTAGGSVTNAQGGVIRGEVDGVLTFGPPSTVINQGYIAGTIAIGVALSTDGVVSNTASGTIAGNNVGVYTGRGSGSVLTNDGFIVGYQSDGAVLFGGGTIDNGSLGWIAGGEFGVYTGGLSPSTITNEGKIDGETSIGAWMFAGGNLTNGGSIFGEYFGVRVGTGPGTVLNTGSISASAVTTRGLNFDSAGVQLADGGVVTNAAGGDITSKWIGVQIGATGSDVGGTVINQGTILAADIYGDGAAVWVHGSGVITNAPGGVISGGAFGIVAYYQMTLVNQGTVFGTGHAFDAVTAGFADRIIVTPGAAFYGTVSGGNTLGSAIYSTLELASGSSTGTIANVGTFVDFGQIALDAGASWSLGGALVAGETVAFGGANASLILATPSAAAATIAGFAATDTIVLSGITDVTGLSFNGDTLTVSESGNAGLTLQFTAPQNLTYAVANGSTEISEVPCFLPGTHILTSQGEVPVEKLRVGDSIVTASGGTRPLCWIGQGRTLATRGRRGPATPVIVRKGALADNVPHRDLHITKGHSLYLDGVLIPVEFLVNHRSILWDDRAQEVTVFHLELDAHDVLIANGALSESYRDDGNRWLFQNANAGWDQPPKPPCAPVLTGGAQVDAIWQRILDRAGARPGLPLTDDPDLHLLVDGVRVDSAGQQGSVWVFRLTERPTSVHIVSREAVPAELGLARDARSLGVALRRIAVRQDTKFVALKASDARLTDGFHAHEAAKNLRWTDGYATLPVELFARFERAVEVVLDVAETTRYPNDGTGSARVAA